MPIDIEALKKKVADMKAEADAKAKEFEVKESESKTKEEEPKVKLAGHDQPPIFRKMEPAEISDLRRKITNILQEHRMRESDVPVSHEYWNLKNRLSTCLNR